MSYLYKSFFSLSLAVGLLISSQAKSFDPNEALRQQEAQRQAQQIKNEEAIYELYRNKETAHVNNDGTVTIGNLQWMRCSLGQQWSRSTCRGRATIHNLNDARALPELMNAQGGFAGHSDWRLPSINELSSLRVCSSGRSDDTINLPDGTTTFKWCTGEYSKPTIDISLFPNTTSSSVWSDSIDAEKANFMWFVMFVRGFATRDDEPNFRKQVRLVRDIQ